jgi:hypothetical protein
MPYIGPEPNPGQNREVDDISSSFNGSLTSFTLQVNSQNISPGSANAIIVSLGGVVQNPGTDYTISVSTLTFTTAPASGLSFFGLVLGQQVDTQSLADGTSPTMAAPTITGDLSIADKIVHTGDTNNAIRFPAADTIAVETAGAERLRVDSLGNLLLGHSSARGVAGTVNRTIQIEATDASASLSIARNEANSAGPFLSFGKTRSSTVGGTTIVNDGDALGTISFAGADGTDLESRGADIIGQVDGTPGVNDMPGRLVFKTTSDGSVSPSERMRLNSNGVLILNGTTETTAPTQPHFFQVGQGSNVFTIEHNESLDVIRARYDIDTTSSRDIQQFRNSNGLVGKINLTSSTTTYSTTSDYRLKENAVAISDGITRLKTLKPYRFNFKTAPNITVDGFFAHEVTAVPEAITGEKDAVDSEGKIDPQGIDQSKLVPLLTAALQEEITKREALETRVAALEAA